jgi:NAD-dependent aldehyde dehydrogenases
VHERVAEAFTAKLAQAVAGLKAGGGFEEDVVIGPLIGEAAVCKVEEILADAVGKGARVLTGGRRVSDAPSGLLFEPTVVEGATPAMRVFSDEIFGPIAPVFTFSSDEEAIRMANDTPFGLAAYFYGRDVARVWRVAEALDYGMVGINTGMVSTAVAPFGGIKQSGYGREGSRYGMDEYTVMKYLCWQV